MLWVFQCALSVITLTKACLDLSIVSKVCVFYVHSYLKFFINVPKSISPSLSASISNFHRYSLQTFSLNYTFSKYKFPWLLYLYYLYFLQTLHTIVSNVIVLLPFFKFYHTVTVNVLFIYLTVNVKVIFIDLTVIYKVIYLCTLLPMSRLFPLM